MAKPIKRLSFGLVIVRIPYLRSFPLSFTITQDTSPNKEDTCQEMPARLEEVKHAKEEGIDFFNFCIIQWDTVAMKKDIVTAVFTAKMELGEPDATWSS